VSIGGAPDDGALPQEDDPVVAVRKRAWEEAHGGKEAARSFVQARLGGWPSRVLADASRLPRGRAFLERVARDTWRGLEAMTDRENGLPIDHVWLDGKSTALADAEIGDYTNVTSIGLRLISLVAARDLGLVTPGAARASASRILDTLGVLETHEGYFYNYYDTTTLERTSNFLSFVDLSWLVAGLIVTRGAFPELAPRASALIERLDLGFFYDEAKGRVSHGYFTHRRARSRYDYGVLYTEARLGVLLAIGKGDVPAAAWHRLVRVFPAACTEQSLPPQGLHRVRIDGVELLRGWYEWSGFRYVPSWGGSMFEALMPTLVLDERALAPASLGDNDRVHAEVQERWATQELLYPVWGLSPSSRPGSRHYGEFGVRILGSRGYGDGVVTPHAAALALEFRSESAAATLRAIAERYPIYGEWGFYDAVDPTSGEVAYQYLGLDQSMLFLAVANHLSGGALRARFAEDPILRRVRPLLAAESFFGRG